MLFDGLFASPQPTGLSYASTPDSIAPIFTQYGRSIYASDIVQSCIDRKATEISKLMPRHIRTDAVGKLIPLPGDSINRLFDSAPNPFMCTAEFLEKVVWCYELNYNAFIYPMYDITYDARGFAHRNYTAFYPLAPTQVDFMQTPDGEIYVKMYFLGGKTFTIPYADVIHIRKKFSVSDVMGGGDNGQPDNSSFSQTLSTYDTLIKDVAKALKASMNIKGMLKLNSALEPEKQRAERLILEKQLTENNAGIISGDYKSDFQAVTIDPKIIDSSTLSFIENKILRFMGVSVPILNGDWNDDQYQSFYSMSLQPTLIRLGQASTAVLFTPTERSYGNKMVYYPEDIAYMTTDKKLKLLEVAGQQGLLTDDQKLDVIGYPPIPDGSGSRRTASLNYIDVNLINEYQLARAGIDAKTPDAGGNTNG